MGRFVELVSDELDIAYTGLGSTTWKRRQVGRGLEADECYFFAIEKLAAVDEALRRMSRDIADYPDPDLAIEVDVSPSKIDRPGIYAALRVAEVWRYEGRHEQIVIERLTPDGTYQAVEVSGFLPVRVEEVSRWVLREDCRNWARWSRGLRAWVQAELIPRLPR